MSSWRSLSCLAVLLTLPASASQSATHSHASDAAEAPLAHATPALPVNAPGGASADQSAPGEEPVAPGAEGALGLRSALSHSLYGRSAPPSLLLKVDYFARTGPAVDRPPLNIALVLDRSGSMAEDKKFSYALDAAREVIQNLSERDTISVVAFNERVLVLSPAGRAVNKTFIFHRLEEISPEGFTDLSAGLLEGLAQVSSKSAAGQVKYVLLLTDGKANRGITNPTALAKLAAKNHGKGIGISTLGVGTDFDEKLLTEVAQAGGGRYTYVRSPEQIPTAFQEELRGLLAVAAQNARLQVRVEGAGSISKVYGQLQDQPSRNYEANPGNVRAGDRGVLLLALKPENFEPGATVQVTTELTFDDAQSGERVSRVTKTSAAFAADWAKQASQENEEVVLYGAVLQALETSTQALEGFDSERFTQARASFDQWHDRARQYALAHNNQDLLNQAFLLKHFMQELDAARAEGQLHAHSEMKQRFAKESDYQRYLLFHHRGEQH